VTGMACSYAIVTIMAVSGSSYYFYYTVIKIIARLCGAAFLATLWTYMMRRKFKVLQKKKHLFLFWIVCFTVFSISTIAVHFVSPLTLIFVLAVVAIACIILLKFKVAPLRRSAFLRHKMPSLLLDWLTAALFSLALISGCTAGALIGTLLSGQPAETVAARLNREFMIIFFILIVTVTLGFFTVIRFVLNRLLARQHVMMQNVEPNTLGQQSKQQRAHHIVYILSLLFSVLALIQMVHGVYINDLKTAVPGAFIFLVFISPALREHAKLENLNMFCLFVVTILWYQVFSLTIMSVMVVAVSTFMVIAALYTIIKGKIKLR